jgi:beta-glucanase (GH16 family)
MALIKVMSAFFHKLPICRLPAMVMRAGCFAFAIFGGLAQAVPPAGYRLAWQDEFDGSALDSTKWGYRTDTRFWSKQLPANVSVSGGFLNLHLKKEAVDSVQYTAGGVISKNRVRYGYYESRLKVPPGRGWHTSFWMMKSGRLATDTVATELDVLENDSVSPLKYGVNVHRHLPTPHLTYGTKTVTTPSLSASFNTLGCEYTPTTIKYFFNGALVQTVNATLFAHDDLNIWLTSIAAPLGGTTSVDDTQLPAVAQYDYVRFYEPIPAPPPSPTVSIVNPASAAVTLADRSTTLRLEAVVDVPSGTPTVAWSLVDGPGTVTFSSSSATQTNASFSANGTYTLRCTATNEGGPGSDIVRVGVAAPTMIELRQETGGYQHAATIIRGDQTTWNAGSRDQLLVGRTTAPFRSLFSFDLSPLSPGAVIQEATMDLKTVGGVGTVGALQLRGLSATPVEGTGTADGSTGSDLGTGTGATWTTRTGGSQAADLWTSPGGDFTPDVLTEAPGFDATVLDLPVTLPATPALTAAVQTAHAAGQPLNLILSATNESLAAYVRLASDDSTTEVSRPVLRLTFTGNPAPTVNPGLPPAAIAGSPAQLAGVVSDSGSSQWSLLSGPGAASFSNDSSPASTVTFDQAGTYLLELVAIGTFVETSRTLLVYVDPNPATLSGWQALTWPGVIDPNTIGASMDPDKDGLSNLLEWALHLDATIPSTFRPVLTKTATELQYTYTRRKTAPGEAAFQLEWSDTLANNWSSIGVIEGPPLSLSATSESVTAAIPSGSIGKRFLRLKVLIP